MRSDTARQYSIQFQRKRDIEDQLYGGSIEEPPPESRKNLNVIDDYYFGRAPAGFEVIPLVWEGVHIPRVYQIVPIGT